MYVGSQLFGSVSALIFLTPAVVACLGSAALIFNFLFAAVLAKTVIHSVDVLGTLMIILGSVIVAVFGTLPESGQLDLTRLLELYRRPLFIAYFTVLIGVAVAVLLMGMVLRRIVDNPEWKYLSRFRINMRPA